jgi:hypothetical protein
VIEIAGGQLSYRTAAEQRFVCWKDAADETCVP